MSKYIKQQFVKIHLDVCFRIRLPSGHLPAQSQQQKHQNKVRNIYKVNKKDTAQGRSSALFPRPSVSNADPKQVNARQAILQDITKSL